MEVISIPSGWDLNPSSYRARLPVAALALLGLIVSFGELSFVGFSAILITAIPGGKKRWARQPWLVILHAAFACCGILIALASLQPWIEGSGGLTINAASSALIGILVAGPALDEALAALQFVERSHRRPMWRAFLGLSRQKSGQRADQKGSRFGTKGAT